MIKSHFDDVSSKKNQLIIQVLFPAFIILHINKSEKIIKITQANIKKDTSVNSMELYT